MSYTDLLKTELNNQIASMLGDVGKVYRTDNEINLLIKEALLTFGAISGYWKSKLQIETTNNASIVKKEIYDLEDEVELAPSLTYQDIIDWLDIDLIGYTDLVEPNELLRIITNAINIFQTETKLVVKKSNFDVAAGQPVTINGNVLDILAAYYIDSSGIYYTLQLADENRIALANIKHTLDSNRPKFYVINNDSLGLLDLFPRPSENGQLQIIYVVGRLPDSVTDSTASCIIPDNLVPYLKYKTEHDIFSKDDNRDSFRAEYCLLRWNEGLVIGKNYSAIVNAKLDGINKPMASVIDFNNLRYGWRNDIETTTKRVNAIAHAGYNSVAINRVPIDTHSLLFEVISAAPYNGVHIDLRPDYIPILIDYILHIASIKDGIAAIQSTNNRLEKFLKAAIEHNNYLQMRRISYNDLVSQTKYALKQAKIKQ